MTPQERNAEAARQKKFIRDLSASVLADMMLAIDRDQIPTTWDGHQLRQWLVIAFEHASLHQTPAVKREVRKVVNQIDDERRNK